MKPSKERVLLPAVLLVSTMLSGCMQKDLDNFFASDRRIPDNSQVTFDNRRPPMLNPDPGSNGVKRVPVENGVSSQNQPEMPASFASSPQLKTENIYPPVQKSPVVPVASTEIAPPNTSSDGSYPTLANIPPAPAKSSSEKIKSDFSTLSDQQKTTEGDRKNLMENKDATLLTSPKAAQSSNVYPNNVSSVDLTTPPATVTQQQNYDTATTAQPPSRQLAIPAFEQDKPASNPAKMDSSDNTFSSWLHNTFTQKDGGKVPADQKRVPVENNNVIASNANSSAPVQDNAAMQSSMSAEMPKADTSSFDVPPAPPQQNILPPMDTAQPEKHKDNTVSAWFGNWFNKKKPETPPAVETVKTDTAPEVMPAEKIVTAMPVEKVTEKPMAETKPDIKPQPENTSVASSSDLPGTSKLESKDANRVNLVQPSNYNTSPSNYGYIEESRYSKKSSEDSY